MEFDLFDAFLLDADFALLETAFSAAAAAPDSPHPAASALAQTPPPPPPPPPPPSSTLSQQPPARQQQLSRSSPRRSDSDAESDSDAGVGGASDDAPSGGARSEPPKAPYLPPCRVCSGPASGFHYGVNTCEACKGFFHRSLRRRSPYKCSKDSKCYISYLSRGTCSACRYQKCLAIGMTKDAVKTGRYSHTKRTQDTLEVKRLLQQQQGEPTESSPESSACLAVVTDHQPVVVAPRLQGDGEDCIMDASSRALVQCLASAFEQSFAEVVPFYKEPTKIENLVRDTLCRHGSECLDRLMFDDPDEWKSVLEMRDGVCSSASRPVAACDSWPSEGSSAEGLMAAMKRQLEKLETMIRSIVSFAKCIPGYTSLKMHDQIVLIKAGRAELMHLVKYKQLDLKLSCAVDYDRSRDVVTLMPLSLMRRVWHNDEFYRQCCGNARRLQQLGLSVSEVALLAAVALTSPDREHLLEPERVHTIQETLVAALRHSIATDRHPRGDLPAANCFLAELLLQLPLLRTFSQQNLLIVQSMQQRFPIGLPPLVQECVSSRQADVQL